jgi:hypothetical protein
MTTNQSIHDCNLTLVLERELLHYGSLVERETLLLFSPDVSGSLRRLPNKSLVLCRYRLLELDEAYERRYTGTRMKSNVKIL